MNQHALPEATGVTAAQEIVFVDPRVADWQRLTAGLARPAAIYVVDPAREALTQMAAHAATHVAVDAIHVVAHGRPGALLIGSTPLTREALAENSGPLKRLADALADEAEILLYGCRLAASPEGIALIEALEDVLGCYVAASTAPVGAAALGGNWRLDYPRHRPEASIIFNQQAQAGYPGVLNSNHFISGLSGDTATFFIGGSAVALDTDTPVSISGSATYTTDSVLTVTITNVVGSEDVLGIDTSGTVALSDGTNVGSTVTVGGTTVGAIATSGTGANGDALIVNLDGSVDNTNFATLLSALQYSNSNTTNPTTTARTITVQTYISASDSGTHSVSVNVTSSPPSFADLAGDSATFTEGGSAVALDANGDATLTDSDSTDFNGGTLTVSVAANKVAGEDVLGFDTSTVTLSDGTNVGSTVTIGGTNVGTIATSGTGRSGDDLVITLNANATPANIQALIRTLQYSNTNTANPDTTARTVRVTVSDGDGATSTNQDVTINVNGVNDAPAIANLAGDSATFTEGGSAVALDANGDATLTDSDSTDFNGGTMTVSVAANKVAGEDVLGFDTSTVTLSDGTNVGSTVTIGGTNVGTIATSGTGRSGDDLVVTLNASATPANIQALIRTLQYSNTNTDNPDTTARTVRVTVSDGDGGSSTNQDVTVSVAKETTAPTIQSVSIPDASMNIGDIVGATITVTSDSDDYTRGSGGISGTIGGFTLSNLARTDATTYTAQFTVTSGGTDVAATSDIPVNLTLTDSSGNASSAFTTAIAQTDDGLDANVPALQSATVNGSTLTLRYGETLDGGADPAASQFTVTVNGNARTVTNVNAEGSNVILNLAAGVSSGDTVSISYTVPGSNPIRDTAGNGAAAITAQTVTNATPAPPPPPPPTTTVTTGEDDAPVDSDGNRTTTTTTTTTQSDGSQQITVSQNTGEETPANTVSATVRTQNQAGGGTLEVVTATITGTDGSTQTVSRNRATTTETTDSGASRTTIQDTTTAQDGSQTVKTTVTDTTTETDTGGQVVTVENQTVTEDNGNQVTTTVRRAPVADSGTTEETRTIAAPTLATTNTSVDLMAVEADLPDLPGVDNRAALQADIAQGTTVTASGRSDRQTPQEALADLVARIEERTQDGSADETALAGQGQGFLNLLDTATQLVVRTVVPTLTEMPSDSSTPVLTLRGETGSISAGRQEAVVLDTSALPDGTTIALDNVEFVAIIGSGQFTGGSGQNIITADSAAQVIVLGADSDTLNAGGGDDVVGSAGGDDVINGEGGNDLTFGGAGNDTVDGGAGVDAVRFVDALSALDLTRNDDGSLTVVSVSEGTDAISNMEVLIGDGRATLIDAPDADASGFDSAFYLAQNPDVAAAVAAGQFTSAKAHFELFGNAEQRDSSALFDSGYYLTQNPDVAAAVDAGQFTSAVAHYV